MLEILNSVNKSGGGDFQITYEAINLSVLSGTNVMTRNLGRVHHYIHNDMFRIFGGNLGG